MLYGNESCATDWCTGAGRPILTESQLAALEKAKADEAAHASSTARAAKMMGNVTTNANWTATAGRRLHHQPGLSLRPRPCSRGRGASVNDRAIGSILALVATNRKPPASPKFFRNGQKLFIQSALPNG